MKTILYLGTDPSQHILSPASARLIHYPVIKIVPRPINHPELIQAFSSMDEYTHLIFTSKNAVQVFFDNLTLLPDPIPVSRLCLKKVIAIGKVTASYLAARGLPAHVVSSEETQEGVVELLSTMDLGDAYLFMPRSSLSRHILANFFEQRQLRFHACDLYHTVSCANNPKPDLDQVDEIVFTSPSTVRAYMEIFGNLPAAKKCVAIGPVTQAELVSCLRPLEPD